MLGAVGDAFDEVASTGAGRGQAPSSGGRRRLRRDGAGGRSRSGSRPAVVPSRCADRGRRRGRGHDVVVADRGRADGAPTMSVRPRDASWRSIELGAAGLLVSVCDTADLVVRPRGAALRRRAEPSRRGGAAQCVDGIHRAGGGHGAGRRRAANGAAMSASDRAAFLRGRTRQTPPAAGRRRGQLAQLVQRRGSHPSTCSGARCRRRSRRSSASTSRSSSARTATSSSRSSPPTACTSGNIGLHRIDWQHAQAEFGIVVGERDYWGRGIGIPGDSPAVPARLRAPQPSPDLAGRPRRPRGGAASVPTRRLRRGRATARGGPARRAPAGHRRHGTAEAGAPRLVNAYLDRVRWAAGASTADRPRPPRRGQSTLRLVRAGPPWPAHASRGRTWGHRPDRVAQHEEHR